MYATIMSCERYRFSAALANEGAGRTLGGALAKLPGFVAFIALDRETEASTVTAVCLMEECASLAAAERVIAQWQGEQATAGEGGVQRLGAGEVIAQWGL